MSEIRNNRDFMKAPDFSAVWKTSDQSKQLPHPAHGNAVTGTLIQLPKFDRLAPDVTYTDLLNTRRSERAFTDKSLTQEELAFLLWSAQGIQSFRGADKLGTLRPVPSAGARHPIELYAVVQNVKGLASGLYRYAPLEHVGEKLVAVEFLGAFGDYENRITNMLSGQRWASAAPIVLFLSAMPYRTEWRHSTAAHRLILIDVGHVGQNIMLSSAALNLGSCCIAVYDQKLCDEALGLDGENEYVVYVIPVGVPRR